MLETADKGQFVFVHAKLEDSDPDKSKVLSHRVHLNDPIRIYKGENPYNCSYCHKSFYDKSNLKIHLRTHRWEKSFSSNYCQKSFSGRNNLNQHMRTHTGEKPYSFYHCQKSFSIESNLEHMRTRTGEKTYSFVHCQKAFYDKRDLKGTVSRDFLYLVFSPKQLLLVPLEMS